jgi:carboxylate-amine ligase
MRDDELTMGVEEEFLLLDAESGQLRQRGIEVLADADGQDADLQPELVRSQVESASPVCRTATELLASLRASRQELAASAEKHGLRLLACGTPILAEQGTQLVSPGDRYAQVAERFGALADTAVTSGLHVHIGMPDSETAVAVSNHIRSWLPVLLALSTNSPFVDSADTGYASWRSLLWSRWPTAGTPPYFASLEDYEATVQGLLRTGAAMDRRMIYWHARLSDRQPTLEVRVCDVTPTVDEAVLIALLIRGLVAVALRYIEQDAAVPQQNQEILRGALWRAARDGLNGECLDPNGHDLVPTSELLNRLVAKIEPTITNSGELDLITATLSHVREHGSGAHRQREAFARRESFQDVIDLLAAETVRT